MDTFQTQAQVSERRAAEVAAGLVDLRADVAGGEGGGGGVLRKRGGGEKSKLVQ